MDISSPCLLSVFQIVELNPRQLVYLLKIQEHFRQIDKITVLHTFEWWLVRQYLQRQPVLRAPELVIVKLRMLLGFIPDGVESRAERFDHAGEDIVTRDEGTAF